MQGAWFGFRSAAAGGRLLQARRRGCSRLAFFSAGFGVWEQWELVAGDPTAHPWACLPLGFRSRRLPQVLRSPPRSPPVCAKSSSPIMCKTCARTVNRKPVVGAKQCNETHACMLTVGCIACTAVRAQRGRAAGGA